MSSSSPIQTPVTGGEETSDQRQAAHALAQFYRALNSRDLRLMQENWANSAEAVIDVPARLSSARARVGAGGSARRRTASRDRVLYPARSVRSPSASRRWR